MGLDIVVGIYPDLFDDPIDSCEDAQELREYEQEQFARLNTVLRQSGLPTHDEPTQPSGRAPWSLRVGRPACLHYLRRIAAHLWAGNGLPAPCLDSKASHDPVLRRYYQTLRETPNLPFAHLINHADDCGYYLPVPFSTPLEPGFAVIENAGCQVIGSSYTLLDECACLADFLELTLELDPEMVREASLSQEKGEAIWERYGIESFVCAALHTACEISVQSGCALVFC